MVEHNLSVVSTLANHITVLARGEVLAQGNYASVSTNPAVADARAALGGALAMAGSHVRLDDGAAPEGSRPAGVVWRVAHPARRRVRRRPGRSCHAARPQRGGQDDDAEIDHGRRAAPRRLGDLRAAGNRATAVEPDRTPRHRLVSRGAWHLLEPERRGEPDAAAESSRGRSVGRADLQAVSEPARTPQEPGNETVGRRAADARDRPHPAHRRAPADARRAYRRLGAGDRPADRQDDPRTT